MWFEAPESMNQGLVSHKTLRAEKVLLIWAKKDEESKVLDKFRVYPNIL